MSYAALIFTASQTKWKANLTPRNVILNIFKFN